jgi:hypothetical protein
MTTDAGLDHVKLNYEDSPHPKPFRVHPPTQENGTQSQLLNMPIHFNIVCTPRKARNPDFFTLLQHKRLESKPKNEYHKNHYWVHNALKQQTLKRTASGILKAGDRM